MLLEGVRKESLLPARVSAQPGCELTRARVFNQVLGDLVPRP